MPSGANADPKQCYRITGQNQDGLWEVVETGKTFRSRKHSRLWRRFEVTINIRDERHRTSRRSQVFTRDVSPGGMCVWGPLDAEIGDRVKVASKAHDFYSMAMVRNRTDDDKDDARSLIHFEFIGAEFPVAKVAMLPENTRFEDAQPEPTEHEDDQLHVPGMGPDSFENEMTA
uniref:PilZ domain-containing protein n=1 Tax=uncultured bacterium 164 TaxID=698382 RepID=E3T703_9BACT|nr:hypothetical protein [uncultured bacterium 164]